MSKTDKSKVSKVETVALTKADLNTAIATPENSTPAGIKLTAGAFDSLTGETFSGLNILKLNEGEAAGPFRFLKTVVQTMPAKGKKPAQDVTCYVGEHLAYPGREVRLPIAAAFTKKCEDAKLTAGDIIAVRRSGDYVDKTYKQTCQGFDLKVLARNRQTDAIAAIVAAYPPAN
jgi:hypothetical protein